MSTLTEQDLRTGGREATGMPEPPAEILDRLNDTGHDRNGFCRRCWADAGRRAQSQPAKSQADHYLDVIAEAEAAASAPKETT